MDITQFLKLSDLLRDYKSEITEFGLEAGVISFYISSSCVILENELRELELGFEIEDSVFIPDVKLCTLET